MYQHLSSDEERIITVIRDYVKNEANNEHVRRTANQRADLDQLFYEIQSLTRKYPDDQDITHLETLAYRLLY